MPNRKEGSPRVLLCKYVRMKQLGHDEAWLSCRCSLRGCISNRSKTMLVPWAISKNQILTAKYSNTSIWQR